VRERGRVVDRARRLLVTGRKEGLERVRWRVGRSVGRTIYAVVEAPPAVAGDVLIGMLDTKELAAAAVRDHNAALERQR
jgi:hypothetical protein